MQMPLVLDPSAGQSLTSQIVEQLRDAIRRGRITRGTKLPSSRRLSEQLGVSRNTVVRAYEELSSEGYVEARPASCIAVAADLPDCHALPPDAAPGLQRDEASERRSMPMPALALRAPDLVHRNRGRL
jgi:GntR family transcriptional regulator / MocR family aminotransferase